MRRLPFLVALLQAGALAAAERVVREVRVDAPGSYWVELATEDLVRRTDSGGVEMLGPDGEPVDSRVVTGDPSSRCLDARVVGVGRELGRWRIRLRAPAALERHAELRFLVDRAVLAADCRLESSSDGEHWSEIARADLFRLGDEPGLARTSLEYPANGDRELLLSWPDAGGEPTVHGAELCPPRAPAAERSLPAQVEALAAPEPGGARFRVGGLPLSVRPRALELSWVGGAPAAAAGFRLRQEGAEGWHEISRGRIPAGQEHWRLELDRSASFVFETYGFAPAAISGRWSVEPQRLEFEARRAGLHQLRLPARRGSERVALGADPVRLETGPPVVEPLTSPRSPAGREADRARIAMRWPVVAAGALPGDPVQVELGEELAKECRHERTAELVCGVTVGGRWLPARALPAGVVPVAEPRSVAPSSTADGRSAIELGALPRARRLLVRAAAAEGPFERTVALVASSSAPGTERREALGRAVWRCDESPPLPCELAFDLLTGDSRELGLEIEDGASAPLERLTIEPIGARTRLLLPWGGPGTELVRMAPPMGTPPIDDSGLVAALELVRPLTATLGAPIERRPSAVDRHGRLLLGAAVGAVAVGLLLLLRRLLSAGGTKG